MKKQVLSIVISSVLVTLNTPTLYAAQKHHSTSHQSNSQIKVINDIQVAIDFQTMAQHHKMMKMMKLKMKHTKDSTHHVSVTLMHKKDNHIIKDAVVKIKLIGPDKKTLGSEKGTKMYIMSGKGMHHFGADYVLKKKGQYNALILFKVKGKIYKSGFTFGYS